MHHAWTSLFAKENTRSKATPRPKTESEAKEREKQKGNTMSRDCYGCDFSGTDGDGSRHSVGNGDAFEVALMVDCRANDRGGGQCRQQ